MTKPPRKKAVHMTAERFKKARESFGLSQVQMAKMLGYADANRVSEIEGGRRSPSSSVALLMKAFLEGYRPKNWPAKGDDE